MGVRDFKDENFVWPTSVAEVCDVVRRAARAGGKLRVRGSQHSDAPAVYTDGFDPVAGPQPNDAGVTNLLLDGLRAVSVRPGELVVQAGRHIGADPYGDPPVNQEGESLVGALNALGLALPALGGISHQALGGFLSTGSAGGSTWHDPADAVSWLRFVDGTGALQRVDRGTPEFDAALVALGLFGVLVEVGFNTDPQKGPALPERYDVKMHSRVCRVADWREDGAPFDWCAPGALEGFFKRHEYARVLWWPQPLVDKVQIWTGARALYDDKVERKPYENLAAWQQTLAGFFYRHVLGTGIDQDLDAVHDGSAAAHEKLAGLASAVAAAPLFHETLEKLALAHALPLLAAPRMPGSPAQRDALAAELRKGLAAQQARLQAAGQHATLREHLVAALINLFIRDEDKPDLYDDWHKGLPHDNQIDDDKMPVIFTECWVELSRAHEVMQELRRLFDAHRLAAAGTLCVEIYPAKARAAWLSPAHDVDVVRVDPFVFWIDETTRQTAVEHFFPLYWQALQKFDYRNHWGKVLDPDPAAVALRHRAFPKLEEFKRLRARYDPKGLFLNRYWRDRLGIP
jgi:FAD/FMN-containing dehydrogenase